MKEATGELSTTAITVVAIAAVLTIMTTFIVPILKNSIKAKTYCSSAVCSCDKNVKKCDECYYQQETNGTFTDVKITCDNPSYEG